MMATLSRSINNANQCSERMENQIQTMREAIVKKNEAFDKDYVLGELRALRADVNSLLEGKTTTLAASFARHAMGSP